MGGDGSEGKKKGGGGRLLFWLVFFAMMGLAAGVIWINSGSGRRFVENRLEKWMGMPLTIQGASVGLPCDVVIANVESENYAAAGEPGFRADELRIGLRVSSRLAVAVHRGTLKLMRNEDGSWAPSRFSELGALPSRRFTDLSRLTSGLREGMALRVNDSSISWMNSEGVETCGASGVIFGLEPIRVPRRRMYYYFLSVHTLTLPEGQRAHDVEREWLASDTRECLELYRSGRGVPAAVHAFWEAADDKH